MGNTQELEDYKALLERIAKGQYILGINKEVQACLDKYAPKDPLNSAMEKISDYLKAWCFSDGGFDLSSGSVKVRADFIRDTLKPHLLTPQAIAKAKYETLGKYVKMCRAFADLQGQDYVTFNTMAKIKSQYEREL